MPVQTVSPSPAIAALRTLAGQEVLLRTRDFPAKVVTEADRRRVGYVLSRCVHGVAETRFEERAT